MNNARWAIFWRKVENLLRGGMPLLEVLKLLERQGGSAQKEFVGNLRSRLEKGESFTAAVGENRPLWRGIILAGERSGNLAGAVCALAERLEAIENARGKFLSALAYPFLVLLLCVAMTLLVGGLVVPRFGQLFVSLGLTDGLPLATRAILSFSRFLKEYAVALIFLLGAGGFVLYLLRFRMRDFWEKVLEGLPVLGRLYRMFIGSEALSSLGLLLKNALPLNEALAIVAEASTSRRAGAMFALAASRVGEGDSLAQTLGACGYFSEDEAELLSIAERSGLLRESAERLAEITRERFERELMSATRLVEPVLIVLMAMGVGFLLVALFSPLMPLVGRLAEGI